MPKDYDYYEFMRYMQHFSDYAQLLQTEQRARTFKELAMLDELEAEVVEDLGCKDAASLLAYAENL